MDKNDKGNLLRVQRVGGEVNVEVMGNGADVLTNWLLITHAVCENLNIPPVLLAAMMPGAVDTVKKNVSGVKIDLAAMQRAKEGRDGNR